LKIFKKLSSPYTSLSPRRERFRVRGIISPPHLSSPLKGEEIKEKSITPSRRRK